LYNDIFFVQLQKIKKIAAKNFSFLWYPLFSPLYRHDIFVPMSFPGYDSASQAVSELSAIGSPTRTLWVSLGTAYILLIMTFGLGVQQSDTQNKKT
jgi:hypothetical protein